MSEEGRDLVVNECVEKIKEGNEKVILFTIPDCHKCKNLKMQLTNAKIDFELHEMNDEEIGQMIERGFRSAPILKVDSTMMLLKDAIQWVKEKNKNV